MSFSDHDYKNISRLCSVYTIKSHHLANDLIFVNSVLLNNIQVPIICELFINRIINYDLRFVRPLMENRSTKDYIFNSPLFRLRRQWNSFICKLDDKLFDRNKANIRSKNLEFF